MHKVSEYKVAYHRQSLDKTNAENSIRDARTPQPWEIFSTP